MTHTTKTTAADPRWRDLYRLGGYTGAAVATAVVLAIAAFFIWPYAPGEQSAAAVFEMIQADALGALMALDVWLLIGGLGSVILLIPLYAALKPVNESYALLSLVLGLISGAAVIVSRPITEVFILSDLYTAAESGAARAAYMAAGEALLATFHGTAWIMYLLLNTVSFLISAILMLRSEAFPRATAYVGLLTTIVTFGFVIPEIGPILLFVPTVTGIVWNVQMARAFFRLAGESAH
jgi:hypothetical protein